VHWSDFAYVQYVTNGHYLCNSLMILEALYLSVTKADRVLMYPEDWTDPEDNAHDATAESKLLAQARDLYSAKLVPIQVQSFARGDATWRDSYTKLLAFNQTQYKRVMSLDSDATVLKVNRSLPRRVISFTLVLTLLVYAAHGRAFPASSVPSRNAASVLARPAFLVQPIPSR
jgi:alpha-N-acetylglucosamine transferase